MVVAVGGSVGEGGLSLSVFLSFLPPGSNLLVALATKTHDSDPFTASL